MNVQSCLNNQVKNVDVNIDLTQTRIETSRLILRGWQETDLDDFFAYASVPGVGEMAGWNHHEDKSESAKILRLFMEEKNCLAVEHKADRRVIGSMGLHYSWANEKPQYSGMRFKEIGYVLAKAYWGRGLMPEALQALIAYCFNDLQLDFVTCCHFDVNRQSMRVIEKSGFTYYADGVYHSKQMNRDFPERQYMLTKQQWRERKNA
jgi:ribosomal-protein-alanine N-acetyltransferase